MGNRWSVKTYTFTSTGIYPNYTVSLDTSILDEHLVSGTLTKTLGDTSKVTFSVPLEQGEPFFPVRTLVEVRFGSGDNWDRKFFGTITKKQTKPLEGVVTFEATGALGSHRFMPQERNYVYYGHTRVDQIIKDESKRFFSEVIFPYVEAPPSAWEKVYSGFEEIPENFGKLIIANDVEIGCATALDSLCKNSKNAYEFLKALTREGAYNAGRARYYWIEDGETAEFKVISGTNTQEIRYDANLISLNNEENPYATMVNAYGVSSSSARANDYPNPFNWVAVNTKKNADGSSPSALDVCLAKLDERNDIIDGVGFDRHILDSTIPWLDMGKYVNLVYYADGEEITVQEQISQIQYDLVNCANDKIKFGKVVQGIVESGSYSEAKMEEAVSNYLPLAGGQMEGAITYDGGTSLDENKLKIRDRYAITCNLIDQALIEQGNISDNDGTNIDGIAYVVRSAFTSVNGGTAHTISVTSNNDIRVNRVFEYNSSKSFLRVTQMGLTTSGTITLQSSTAYVRVTFTKTDYSSITPSGITSLQLEKGSQASSYVPYTMDGVEVAERLNYKLNYFTPQNCSARDVFGNCFYFKENGMVHIHIGANNPTGLNTLYQIGQLPSDCYPLGYAAVLGHEGSELLVSDTGLMRFVAKSTDIIIDLVFKAKN